MRPAGKTTAPETVGGESRKEPRPDDHHTSVENGRYGCDDQADNQGPASFSSRCSADSITGGGTESTHREGDGGDHSDGDHVGHAVQLIRSTNELPPRGAAQADLEGRSTKRFLGLAVDVDDRD